MILRNIGIFLTIIVGIEHIGIMWLEIFGKPDLQAKSFDMDVDFVKQPAAKTALANQGIYNGMLGLLILIVFFLLQSANFNHCMATFACLCCSCRYFWGLYSK